MDEPPQSFRLPLAMRDPAKVDASLNPRRWNIRLVGRKDPVSLSGRRDEWQTLDHASLYDQAYGRWQANTDKIEGLSHVNAPGNDFKSNLIWCAIDIDNAFGPDGQPWPWVQLLIDVFDTFVEVSRSGKGLHIFLLIRSAPMQGRGEKPVIIDGQEQGRLGVNLNGQIAVTGNVYGERREVAIVDVSALGILPKFECSTKAAVEQLDFHGEWWAKNYEGLSDDAKSMIPEMKSRPIAIRDPNHDCDSHAELLTAACILARRGIIGHAAVELLKLTPVDTAWTDAELRHKVESAWTITHGDGTFDSKPIATTNGSEFGELPQLPDDDDDIVGDVPGVPKLPRVMTTKFLWNYACKAVFLINGILAAGQHCAVAGSKKTLKTSLAAAMAISLATGKKFLGYFDVPEPVSVLMLSGESGVVALQSIMQRIMASHGLGEDDAPNMHWSTNLPRLGDKQSMRELVADIKSCNAKVIFLDPMYLCLMQSSAEKAGNLFTMGPLLRSLGDICTKLGVTLVFLHHMKKSAGTEFDLNDMSFSGFAEYARQWVMLKRRNIFNAGRSELRMNVGGSLGHCGDYHVVVEEGILDPALGIGRKWEVDVSPIDPEQEMRVIGDSEEIIGLLENGPLSANAIREATGMNRVKVGRLIESLEAGGLIRRDKSGKYPTYELVEPVKADGDHDVEMEDFGD